MNREQLNALIGKTQPGARGGAVIALRPNDIELGTADDTGGPIGADLARLLDGRLLVQGVSGTGKSWTLRRLLEQTVTRIQQIVIDPEGEFRSIAEHYGHVHIDAAQLDGHGLALAAARAREHRLNLVLDLSELDREGQMQAAAAFLVGLIETPREHWLPALVVIDEVHLLAPHGGQTSEAPAVRKASIQAVVDLMSRGRKRGLCGVLATQRLTRLSKSAASEALNFLIGLNTLDLDVRRAAETIGWGARMALDRLTQLAPGEFVAVGPAFNRSPTIVRIGGIETTHRGARPDLVAPKARGAEAATALLDLDALIESAAAGEAVRDEHTMPDGVRQVRALLRDPGFGLAARLWIELLALRPDGARLADLAAHFGVDAGAVAEAAALLDRYGLLEFMGEGTMRSVRVARGIFQ